MRSGKPEHVGLANNQLVGYSYDAAGNMTHDATTGLNYSFDQENRITGAAGYTYTYDADGNRVEKSNGSTGTIYWSMSPGIVAESDLTGALKSEYLFFDHERVARRDFPSSAVSYYFSDRLGTANIITDSAGAIKSESDYYPYGGELQFVNNDSNRYRFTGKERDLETGLDYFGVRYYSSVLGRWPTTDPYNPIIRSKDAVQFNTYLTQPQNWNRYVFALNNPLKYVDRNGENVYVVMYTTGNSKGDAELKRAAETKASEIKSSKWFNAKSDTVLVRGVYSKQDFGNVIKEANSLDKTFGKVEQLDMFSHSGEIDGPVFHGSAQTPENPNGSTQFQGAAELKLLPSVNWSPTAKAYFYGCNTTSFSESFAKLLHVPTWGTTGFAYFSSRPDRLASDNGGNLYLIDTRFNEHVVPNFMNTTKPMVEHKP